MSVIAGIITSFCALIWLVLGGFILKLTFAENNCFSRWWPRSFSIMFLLLGICLLIMGLFAFFKKPKEEDQKDDLVK